MNSWNEYLLLQQQNKKVEFSSSKFNDLLQKDKAIRITPHKGFVIKTYETKEGGKVYFNICFSDFIAEFHLKNVPESNNLEALRVPLSIGEEIIREDKKGNKYKTYDVVLNTKVVKECKNNVELKKVLAELIQLGISNKYKIEMCKKLFFFPNHKYKGTGPKDHYIRDDQQHKINVIEDEDTSLTTEKNKDMNTEMANTNNYFIIKKPEWDMWFINKDVLEEKLQKLKCDTLPYLRKNPLKDMIDAFEFKPPFLNFKKKKKDKKNDSFKSFLNEYNIDLDDEILTYEKIIYTVCVIQIQLPFFILAEYNKKNAMDEFNIKKCVNLYISDEFLSVFFKKSPLFPTEYNPPYKNFVIRFPFYFETSKTKSQYVEENHLLNVIIPVSKYSQNLPIFKNVVTENETESMDESEDSTDNSIL